MGKTLFLVLFIGFSTIYAQNKIIKGQIVSEKGESVEYANVGVVGTQKGTIADENGYFTLDVSNRNVTDSIYFSHLSFHRKALVIKDIPADAKIILKENNIELAPVEVYAKMPKMRTIKGRGTRFPGAIASISKMQSQRGNQKTKSDNTSVEVYSSETMAESIGDFVTLKEDYIAKEFHLTCIKSNSEKMVFRLNFYKVEEDESLTPLSEKPIYINLSKITKKTDIVENISVFLPKGKIWIDLSLVDIKGEEYVVDFPLTFSGGWVRYDNSFEKLPLGIGLSFAVKGYPFRKL